MKKKMRIFQMIHKSEFRTFILFRNISRPKFFKTFCNNDRNIQIQTVNNNVLCCWFSINILGDKLSNQNLHFFINFRKIVHMDSSEDTWEYQRIVDLILEITSTTSIDKSSTFKCILKCNFRIWVGKSKNDWFLIHVFNIIFCQGSRSRNSDENISSFNDIRNMSLNLLWVSNF